MMICCPVSVVITHISVALYDCSLQGTGDKDVNKLPEVIVVPQPRIDK